MVRARGHVYYYCSWDLQQDLLISVSPINQIGTVVTSLISLAKQFSQDQFYHVTQIIPGFDNICLWLPSFLYYFFHVAMRLLSCAVLYAYFPYYANIFILVEVWAVSAKSS